MIKCVGLVPIHSGGVTEWSNVPDLKSGVAERLPRVRISPPPPVGKMQILAKILRNTCEIGAFARSFAQKVRREIYNSYQNLKWSY